MLTVTKILTVFTIIYIIRILFEFMLYKNLIHVNRDKNSYNIHCHIYDTNLIRVHAIQNKMSFIYVHNFIRTSNLVYSYLRIRCLL